MAFQTNPTARLAGHEDNLLVVEVKRRAVDLEADIRKIEDSFFGRRLNYRFGAAVAVDKNIEPAIRVVENDSYEKKSRPLGMIVNIPPL